MPQSLDIHVANDAERVELYRNVHDVWGGGLSIDAHLKRRLASPQHNRATWYVGCLDGDVVSSLGCYPLRFSVRGTVVKGMAIGAVHTRADCRGRGFAPLMFDRVEHEARESGVAISLLYSDIPPGYYARLGYVECPSHEADFDPTQSAWDDIAADAEPLERMSPVDARSLMESQYTAFHRSRAIFLHRDTTYWDFLEQKGAGDAVHGFGSMTGYLRTSCRGGTLTVRDFALPDDGEESLRKLFAAIVWIGRIENATEVIGWLPRTMHDLFPTAITRRSQEITMLKSLSSDCEIDDTVCAAADLFPEIDHV